MWLRGLSAFLEYFKYINFEAQNVNFCKIVGVIFTSYSQQRFNDCEV